MLQGMLNSTQLGGPHMSLVNQDLGLNESKPCALLPRPFSVDSSNETLPASSFFMLDL